MACRAIFNKPFLSSSFILWFFLIWYAVVIFVCFAAAGNGDPLLKWRGDRGGDALPVGGGQVGAGAIVHGGRLHLDFELGGLFAARPDQGRHFG